MRSHSLVQMVLQMGFVTDVAAIPHLQFACPSTVLSLRLRTRKVLAWQDQDLDLTCLRKPASDSDRDLARIGLMTTSISMTGLQVSSL